jgi:hypothetical protein
MSRKLDNLHWVPSWVSHLGCVKGCLDYLNLDISMDWLFGGTGHAFFLNIGEDACPSGPTAWDSHMLSELGRNLGYQTDGLFGTRHNQDLDLLQKRAWDFVRAAIGEGAPCYGWELEIPEFYVIYGYDDLGYYFSGTECDDGKGPKPWIELGDTGIGIVELYRLKTTSPAGDRTVVREALTFALEFAQSPGKYVFPDYKAGPDGYDLWLKGLQEGKSNRMGMAYNAAVWATCRRHGSAFLREAKDRIGNGLEPLFDQAAVHFQEVAGKLKGVSELYPFSENYRKSPIGINDKSRKATVFLNDAKEAEIRGFEALNDLVNILP